MSVPEKKLRIAVWHNQLSGGGKRALWDQVTGLLARGHEVESWCPDMADQKFLPFKQVCPEHVLPFKRTIAPQRTVKGFGWVAETIVDGENGLRMPNSNPHTMAAVVERFLTDPALAARLCANARPAVLAKWSKPAAAVRLEQVLYSTLAMRK